MNINEENMFEFYHFVGAYIASSYDFDIFDEDVIVNEFLQVCGMKEYKKLCKQFEEVLSIDPFPCEVISDWGNVWFESQQDGREWFTKVLELLKKGSDQIKYDY